MGKKTPQGDGQEQSRCCGIWGPQRRRLDKIRDAAARYGPVHSVLTSIPTFAIEAAWQPGLLFERLEAPVCKIQACSEEHVIISTCSSLPYL